jgi:hypothetical protein
MKATFLKDEQNNVWLVNASNVKVRVCEAKVRERAQEERRARSFAEARQSIHRELDEFSKE